ncbi:MAG: putative transporter [Methanocella sp. PtaU1.Bin125]|nr:MAG: putative transporter [Methanocella sp. PtaU1.Bin125]
MVSVSSVFESISSAIRRLGGFDRQIWMLFAAEIINVFGTSIIRTFLAVYMLTDLHISPFLIGVTLFVSSLAGAVASYAGGSIADAHGRKRVLVIGLTLQIVAYLLISFSLDAQVPFLALVAVLTLSSLVGGIYQSVPDVMVADVVEPGRRVEAYGLLRIGANLGWVIGPVAGGMLLLIMPFSWVFLLSAITTSIYLLIALFELRETKVTQKTVLLKLSDVWYIIKDTPFFLYTLIAALMIIPYQQMYTLLSMYSADIVGLNDFWIGVTFALSGAMVVLFQYVISLRVRNHRLTNALAFSNVVFAIGFAVLVFSSHPVMPFICVAIATVGEMIWSPAGSTMQANLAPEDRRGRYFGFAGLVVSFGFACGPLFGGTLMGTFGDNIPVMWGIVCALFLVCGAGFLLLNRFVPETANAPRGPDKLEKKLEVPVQA